MFNQACQQSIAAMSSSKKTHFNTLLIDDVIFRVEDVPGEGNCFFHALALSLNINHIKIRQACTLWCRTNIDTPWFIECFSQWITQTGDDTPLVDYINARSKPGVSVGFIFGLAASLLYKLDIRYIDHIGRVHLHLLDLPLSLLSFTRHHNTTNYSKVYIGYVYNINWASSNHLEWNHFIRLWPPDSAEVHLAADVSEEEMKEDDDSDISDVTVTNMTVSFPNGMIVKDTCCDKCVDGSLQTECTLQDGDWVCLQHFVEHVNTSPFPCSPIPSFPTHCKVRTAFCDLCPVVSPTTSCTLQETQWVCRTHYIPYSDRSDSIALTPSRQSPAVIPLTPETNPSSDPLIHAPSHRRDWERRCRYIIDSCFTEDQLTLHLLSMDRHNVWKMKFWCTNYGSVISQDYVDLHSLLTNFLKLRLRPPAKPKRTVARFLKVHWTNGILQRVGLRRIIDDPDIIALLPVGAEQCTDNILICNKLNDTIGRHIFNYSKAARDLSTAPPGNRCPCHHLFPGVKRTVSGCVLSGDLDFIKNPILRQRLSFGPKFRETSVDDPLSSLDCGLDQFILRVSEDHKLPLHTFTGWKTGIMNKARSQIGRLSEDEGTLSSIGMNDPNVIRELKWLQNFLVFVGADKAANNIICICKRWYVEQLRIELKKADGAYTPCALTGDEILENQRDFLKPLCIWNTANAKLPYLYATPKLHYDPARLRFIAGSFHCSTSDASLLLHHLLSCVKLQLRKKDDLRITATGIRRFFIIDSFQEVACFLQSWIRKRKNQSLDALDFSTMFTSIPHEDLITRLGCTVDEAAAHFSGSDSNGVGIEATFGRGTWCCTWVKRRRETHKPKVHFFSVATIKALIRFIVENSYVANGGDIMRQTLGIPMGTNSAPTMCNLYLYYYESAFIDKLINEGKVAIAKAFHLYFRYIDDGANIDNPYNAFLLLPYEDGGVYPRALSPKDTSVAGSITFVGMRISNNLDGSIHMTVYDKRKDFPFKVRNYPYLESNIPSVICYNTFLSRLHAFKCICSVEDDFIECSAELANMLRERNYARGRLVNRFRSFLTTNNHNHTTVHTLVQRFKDRLN